MSDNDQEIPIPTMFAQGGDAAKDAAKSVAFQKTIFLTIKDGESIRVRFLTDHDHWLVAKQHQAVPTKPQPESYKGDSWPKAMGCTCRHDLMFENIYNDCYVCDVLIPATKDAKGKNKIKKPSGRDWALVAVREEVVGDGSDATGGPENKGKVVGYRDAKREEQQTDAEGKPTEVLWVPDIRVANFAYNNFFSTLSGFAGHWGTVLDRDIIIKREGEYTDTTYHMIPDGPTAYFNADGEQDGVLDVRRPEVHDRYGLKPCSCGPEGEMVRGHIAGSLDLHHEVSFRASDKWFSMWFTPGGDDDPDGDSDDTSGDASDNDSSTSSSTGDVSQKALEELASRVQGRGQGGDSEQSATSTARDFG